MPGCDPVEAFVQAGETVTSYRRAGRGDPVLLLGAPGSDAAALFDELAGRCRVVHPHVPDDCSAAWLNDLIEALGLERPAIVADRRLASCLADALRDDGGRIGPVLFVDDPGGAAAMIDGLISAPRDSIV